MELRKLRFFIFFTVMSSSSTLEIKRNLTCTVGGSITLPDPVMELGALLYEGNVIAIVAEKKNQKVEQRFMGRLLWDKDTGLFTITGLQTNDSGIYTVDSKDAASYQLSVYEPVPMPGVKVSSVNSENCTLLCFVEQRGQTVLYWYKGEEILNQASTLPSLPLTVDKQGLIPSYICVAANLADRKSLSVNVMTSCREETKVDPTSKENSTIFLLFLYQNTCISKVLFQ
ncbi:CD48 antigen-like [Polymixia lowei]